MKKAVLFAFTFLFSCSWAAAQSSKNANGHAYVDLGLPSGLKWATCNVGATTPEGYGDFFAWGETEKKGRFEWDNYVFRSSGNSMNNVTFSKYGRTDGNYTLDPSDDAAHVNWGGEWRMPTKDEWEELCDNCTFTWTTQNEISGYRVTGPNGSSIFLPAAGNVIFNYHDGEASDGFYWLSGLSTKDAYANHAFFSSEKFLAGQSLMDNLRYAGMSVRPVMGKRGAAFSFHPSKSILTFNRLGGKDSLAIQTNQSWTAAVDADWLTLSQTSGTGDAMLEVMADNNDSSDRRYGTITFTVGKKTREVSVFQRPPLSEYAYVDLGLPSGLLWATCNVGASSPEEYGDYFAWAETDRKAKEEYTAETYHSGGQYSEENETLQIYDDAAHRNWDWNWRMPTKDEWEELRNECKWTWTTLNGVSGFRVAGKNGNSIFLPSAGYKKDTSLEWEGNSGFYWSSTLDAWGKDSAWELQFTSPRSWNGMDGMSINSQERLRGMSVRPVCENPYYVDLGLPSGLLWATCNVGASSPRQRGYRFAWGETVEKENDTWENYKFRTSGDWEENVTFSKYRWKDVKFTLDLEDDAAYANWGENWRMPTAKEWAELRDSCTWTWIDGVGYKVVGPNGKHIYLPAFKNKGDEGTIFEGSMSGLYWSSSLHMGSENSSEAIYMNIRKLTDDTPEREVDATFRKFALYVRPVRTAPSYYLSKKELNAPPSGMCTTVSVFSDREWKVTTDADWLALSDSTGMGNGTFSVITIVNDTNQKRTGEVTFSLANGVSDIVRITQDSCSIMPPYIDLDLPSGLLWATCNVGASSPKENGDYFAWGETKTKEVFSWENYQHCKVKGKDKNGNPNPIFIKYKNKDKQYELEQDDDVAHVKWGNEWHIPTSEEWGELWDYCDWTWVALNDWAGYVVSSRRNSNYIFLPAAGYRDNVAGKNNDEKGPSKVGREGNYWSGEFNVYDGDCSKAKGLWFGDIRDKNWKIHKSRGINNFERFKGASVRPVRKP